ncbi:hypothetical protein KP806_07360 [Paenibacillus sp. N4]|uniref:hypothetical protein n=1 Tax=Paenibacillus vietnamensis TaxID=2590547 RepID=UPI001CD17318|nr:hypothetical protein [Paenibacillus vietnamensis]MCA0754863.1 hypothetical protein [Paenibacillus vietnamensis]
MGFIAGIIGWGNKLVNSMIRAAIEKEAESVRESVRGEIYPSYHFPVARQMEKIKNSWALIDGYEQRILAVEKKRQRIKLLSYRKNKSQSRRWRR